jgi:hypothetical protein
MVVVLETLSKKLSLLLGKIKHSNTCQRLSKLKRNNTIQPFKKLVNRIEPLIDFIKDLPRRCRRASWRGI